MVTVLAHSSAGFFPFRAAFSAFAPDRHPHCSFRGLLKLHSHYGPPDCSPTLCGLCREVPISPVTRTHRSPAIESNHQLFEWVLPPLVISPFGAHAKDNSPRRKPSGMRSGRRSPREGRKSVLTPLPGLDGFHPYTHGLRHGLFAFAPSELRFGRIRESPLSCRAPG